MAHTISENEKSAWETGLHQDLIDWTVMEEVIWAIPNRLREKNEQKFHFADLRLNNVDDGYEEFSISLNRRKLRLRFPGSLDSRYF